MTDFSRLMLSHLTKEEEERAVTRVHWRAQNYKCGAEVETRPGLPVTSASHGASITHFW